MFNWNKENSRRVSKPQPAGQVDADGGLSFGVITHAAMKCLIRAIMCTEVGQRLGERARKKEIVIK